MAALTDSRPRRLARRHARIVVKVGSALLVDAETGRLQRAWLPASPPTSPRLRARGQQVLVVSSGSIALGRRVLGLPAGALAARAEQAAAAVGQIRAGAGLGGACSRRTASPPPRCC